MNTGFRFIKNYGFYRFRNTFLTSKLHVFCLCLVFCLLLTALVVINSKNTSDHEMSTTTGIPDKLWQPKFAVLETS